MRILLVEPDRLQARVYTMALERAGHSVVHAKTAQAAVQATDTQRPDVVVLELQMPGHNGVEFLYEFRSYPEWLQIPIVLHTFVPSHELAYAVTLENELGVRRTLYKPTTSLTMLCETVQSVALVNP
jgi:CheY-like chemotaxis protein